MKLVIVESPSKAKTISKILGKDFIVESSIGHIRDLPKSAAEIPAKYKDQKWSRLGINVEKDFEAIYVVPSDKKKHVTKLKKLVKECNELYLATDEDREGESISWHLLDVLKPKVPVKRLAFHEITKDAILESLENPRDIDYKLVNAQESRRILDRLFGYEVSPVLWKKVAPKLSAGRVQSVTCKLIVEREIERINFKKAVFGSIVCDLESKDKDKFQANLKAYKGKQLAVSKDFDPSTGKLLKDRLIVNGENLPDIQAALKDETLVIDKVESKPVKISPKPPFTTSTLQMDANRKFGFSSKQTMMVAQKLYENGYITYMRTDSVTLSKEAIFGARNLVEQKFGKEYLYKSVRNYSSKVKNAQEAHEAIRPAGKVFKTPESVKSKLTAEQLKLYQLIFNRTLASQMANAEYLQTSVGIKSENLDLSASGRVETFAGFTKLYQESSDKKSEESKILPPLNENDTVKFLKDNFKEHETKPKARYNEASIVKALEEKGIGRPSTYASIIETIIKRGYVIKDKRALVPTFIVFSVVKLLDNHFTEFLDYEFTAGMENDLDSISRGEIEKLNYLNSFYFGDKSHVGLFKLLDKDISALDVAEIDVFKFEDIKVMVGRYGAYLMKGEQKANLPIDLKPDELNYEKASELIEHGDKMDSIGVDPETQMPVFVKNGRFGPYVQLGDKDQADKPKMKGLPNNLDIEDCDLDKAVFLLSLPKSIGVSKTTNDDVILDLGRFGPYIKSGGKNASIAKYDIFTFSLEDADEALKSATGAKGLVREFEGSKIQIKKGRYGVYLTNGKVNVKFPKDKEVDKITLKECEALIKDKQK
ncbi:DNA topoisomerase I [bacterium]|nr:DNA topoisomerase I [bacterium]